jgi:hypothetical protein
MGSGKMARTEFSAHFGGLIEWLAGINDQYLGIHPQLMQRLRNARQEKA